MTQAQKRRSTVTRGVSGVALLALVAGLYFGDGFGFGRGEGQGTGSGQQDGAGATGGSVGNEDADDGVVGADVVLASAVTDDSSMSESGPGEIPATVTILIDGREFYLPAIDGSVEGGAVDHETLVAKALQTTGDESGVRVKIVRRTSARVSAKAELGRLLREAGVPDEAVYWQKQYVD